MAFQEKPVPAHYEQPVRSFTGRTLSGSQEYVDFVPESHLRIWYNNQMEGYDTHHHSAMEIILCTENQYIVITNNQTYTLNAGDILVIPPHMLHKIICKTYGVRFIFLINTEILNCFQDFKTINPLFIEPYLCTASLQPNIYQQVYSSFMKMVNIYFSNHIFWEISIYSLLMDTIATIGQNHFYKNRNDSDSLSTDKQQEHYEKFASLLNFIDANYTEDLTLEQAANYIGFSKYHFSRLFKQHTNTTFYDYLCHKRIQAAQSLLTLDVPITDIAFQTGFNNLTTFCRCFKKCTNCSPTEYRNKLRLEEL